MTIKDLIKALAACDQDMNIRRLFGYGFCRMGTRKIVFYLSEPGILCTVDENLGIILGSLGRAISVGVQDLVSQMTPDAECALREVDGCEDIPLDYWITESKEVPAPDGITLFPRSQRNYNPGRMDGSIDFSIHDGGSTICSHCGAAGTDEHQCRRENDFSPYAKLVGWDELTEEQKATQPDNGIGKLDANYIVFDDGRVFSDAMEPEDATFTRSLSWVLDVLNGG